MEGVKESVFEKEKKITNCKRHALKKQVFYKFDSTQKETIRDT